MRLDRKRCAALAATVFAALAILAPAASATFHLIQIREVYPGSLAGPGSEYVELQMWASGQNEVAGHVVRTYGATGTITATSPFPSDVPRGANQSTLVLATPQAEAQFGFVADASLGASGVLDPSGGAICWEALDCLSWGSFIGSLPSPAGTPASPAGIPDGMALRRTIAAGCPTLLEPADDHDNSAADFAVVFPGPRPNAAPPTEAACASPGGGSGPGGSTEAGRGAPWTTLTKKPPRRSHDRTPTFRFASDEPGSSFQCALDRRRFRACRSPFVAEPLAAGSHSFRVRARASSGAVDRTPARFSFRVLPKRSGG
jgi:hypothetical protein